MNYRNLMASAIFVVLISATATGQTTRNVPRVAARMNLVMPQGRQPGDTAIWVHPTKRSESVIVATDSQANRVAVFNLDGKMLDSLKIARPGDVDVRYNFPLGGGKAVDIIGVVQQQGGSCLVIYTWNPTTKKLKRLDDGKIFTGAGSQGGCFYHNRKTNTFYFFVTKRSGDITQVQLMSDGQGRVTGKRLKKRLQTSSECRAAVADDFLGALYVSEKSHGVIKFNPEPTGAKKGEVVAQLGTNGLFKDVEGIALYQWHGSTGHGGYLVISSQGTDRFLVYDRRTLKYEGSFVIRGAKDSRYLSMSSVDFGSWFTGGLMLCSSETGKGKSRILGVPWKSVAFSFEPKIRASKTWDPRDPEQKGKATPK